jgi:hypothetical protein
MVYLIVRWLRASDSDHNGFSHSDHVRGLSPLTSSFAFDLGTCRASHAAPEADDIAW